MADVPVERLSVDTIRTLSMDAVQRAGSGHPGTAMALAPVAYVLWKRHLRFNPKNPEWFDRDRFVLSAGHAAILQYSVLHLTGYEIPLEELECFRQDGSITPGHPESFLTPGIETTTGPLGQGLMNSAGIALAEAHLAAVFNRPGHEIVGHRTYVICSDGDMMEGASHEAASLAGHLGLDKLTWIYDDNRITIDGDTDLAFSDDVGRRFEAYGWDVRDIGDRANDLVVLDEALAHTREERDRPSLIIVRSHIGYGSPNKQDTASAHGAPLGEEEVRLTKRSYGWPEDASFLVPKRVRDHMGEARDRGEAEENDWNRRMEAYRATFPELADQFDAWLEGELPSGWDAGIPIFEPTDGPMATRKASGKVLNGFAERVPWLMGGSADLMGSNNSRIAGSGAVGAATLAERNIYWGIREHVMCGACNGMALHGGVRPYAATFFIFTDYARPSIRLAALMRLPVIYIMTHDSIGLGSDGPTHQPVEHLASLRAMPNLRVIRPCDANEVAIAWRVAIEMADGPNMLVLSRQAIPIVPRGGAIAGPEGLARGAYVISPEQGERPAMILMASGAEVHLALAAQSTLRQAGVDARVVSMPCWELFRDQSAAYRESVLPCEVRARVAVEAGVSLGWHEWVGDSGTVIGVERFGASAPAEDNFRNYGLTAESVVERASLLLEEGGHGG